MKKLVINQLPVEYVRGRRVLVRIDADTEESCLGLPLDESKALSSLPTVEYLVGLGARVVIGTEVGNPRGKVVESLRLDALSGRISELLGRPVRKLDEATGRTALRAVTEMQDGDIVLLENLGFYPGEATNDAEFAHQLADLGDIYCNDAFALAHRARASTVGITRYLRPAAAGLEFGRELMMFESVLDRPESPFLAIVAGARIEKKLPILENLAPRLNSLFIGGALSFTFITASGCEVGAAPVDEALLPLVQDFLRKAEGQCEVILPEDFIVVNADQFHAYVESGRAGNPVGWRCVRADEILSSDLPVDIGPETVKLIQGLIKSARTVFWNGPLGIWEIEPFWAGTREVARALIEGESPRFRRAIVSGDNLTRAIREFDLPFERIRHLTRGGESALKLLAGRPLPAAEALTDEVDLIAPIERPPLRVLLPADGSDHSLEVARRIGRLVEAERSEINLLYVQKPMALATEDTWVDPEAKREREIERRLEAEKIFASVNAALARQGLTSHRQYTVEGNPADEILNFAQQISADLIAMGSHGLTGVLRILMGSVSRKVLDHARCAVLIVRIPDQRLVEAGMLEP